jgi:hypothetical protein
MGTKRRAMAGRLWSLPFLVAMVLAFACCAPSTGTPTATTPGVLSATATPDCGGTPPAQAKFTDPFAYCACVGTVDVPDARYTGPQVPDSVANALRKALNVSTSEPADLFARGTSWRCMDGKVYGCNVGANIPCTALANTSREPTQPMLDFCSANQNADVIPAVVTGHNGIYDWRCNNGAPEIVKQVFQVDPRGYIRDFWYELKPNDP